MGTPATIERVHPDARTDAALVYLSGPLRGRSVAIREAALHIARKSGALLAPGEAAESPRAATLCRAGSRYELVAAKHQALWVNGLPVRACRLESGDLIEIADGPVLCFHYGTPATSNVLASVPQAAGTIAAHRPMQHWLQSLRLARAKPRGLVARTWRRARVGIVLGLAAFVAVLVYLGLQTHDLERQLAREQSRVSAIADLLSRLEGQTLTRDELSSLRDEFGKGLTDTDERVKLLEYSSAAAGRIILLSSSSVALVQGSFGFEDPATHRSLRFAVGEDGRPVRMADGRPLMTLEGSGPPVEIGFSGTAFVAADDGILLTNRHVALPWEDGASLPTIRALGLEPVTRRMKGYLRGASEPFDLKVLGMSETHDVAVLQGDGAARTVTPLPLASRAPAPGEAAVVLGFPTGIRAMLARAGDAFVAKLGGPKGVDAERAAVELARAGLIEPLASRGIVGQVSSEAIVYDAQTASGGSGGPVLNLSGEVMAINRATLPDFGGSNLGVPARHAQDLMRLLRIAQDDAEHSPIR